MPENDRKISVHIAGAGTGDPGLVTLRCMSCIENAEVIIYDHLVSPTLLNKAAPECELIYAGKRAGNHYLNQDEINRLMVRYAREGKDVLRLKGGDPFVFGRGGEEAEFLADNGVSYEVIPGVSSCYCVPEGCGIPVTHRDYASSFHVITGHHKKGNDKEDYSVLARLKGTLVFLMGLGNIGETAAELIENGKAPDTPSAVISQGMTGTQKTVTAPLCEIAEKAANMSTPAVIVIGDVVRLSDKLDVIDKSGLYGTRILTVGTQKTAASLNAAAREYNGTVTQISLIRTEMVNTDKLAELNPCEYTHIVFFSSNGINLFFRNIDVDIRGFYGVRFAVTGRACAEELKKYGIAADIVPEEYNSTDLARELKKELCADSRVLVIRAENSAANFTDELWETKVTELVLYRTVTDYSKKELLNKSGEFDYIALMSGSAARALAELYDSEICAKIIAIGKHTADAANKAGLKVYKIAGTATARGIIEAIMEDCNEDQTEKKQTE